MKNRKSKSDFDFTLIKFGEHNRARALVLAGVEKFFIVGRNAQV